jgi:2-phosphosulfolactate phosphatase
VIRATTSLTVALAHGATRIIPVGDVEEARAIAARTPGAILCGERGGRMVPGYDMGNSPPEFAASACAAPHSCSPRPTARRLIHAAARASGSPPRSSTRRPCVERVARAKRVVLVCAGALGISRSRTPRAPAGSRARCATAAPDSKAPKSPWPSRSPDEPRRRPHRAARQLRRPRAQTPGQSYAADVEFCAELDSLPQAFAI